MRTFRKAFFIINAVLFVLSACGNNTSAPVTADPATTTSASTAAPLDLVFTGNATGGPVVSIEFFDDYLEKVLAGNPYDNSIAGSEPFDFTHELPFELKITSFYYYGSKVDVTCAKNIFVNRIKTVLNGSLPNGHTAIFSMGSDGVFYACDTIVHASCDMPSYWIAQGSQDEITLSDMFPGQTIMGTYSPYNPTFTCSGSDGNDYTVGLYGDYDYQNLSIHSSFDILTGVYSGVVSVKRTNYLDHPINLFIGQ
jgi:hypothetical protein